MAGGQGDQIRPAAGGLFVFDTRSTVLASVAHRHRTVMIAPDSRGEGKALGHCRRRRQPAACSGKSRFRPNSALAKPPWDSESPIVASDGSVRRRPRSFSAPQPPGALRPDRTTCSVPVASVPLFARHQLGRRSCAGQVFSGCQWSIFFWLKPSRSSCGRNQTAARFISARAAYFRPGAGQCYPVSDGRLAAWCRAGGHASPRPGHARWLPWRG